MNTDVFKGALYNKYEACLDSGKLIRTLISKVSALGIKNLVIFFIFYKGDYI